MRFSIGIIETDYFTLVAPVISGVECQWGAGGELL